ncbi:hypothetical protein [Dactylosporangium sp. NPDC048998]|uniref:hypothetical protein n=1 Tax=Dactylosporangium sp. NPDC048998 TaxID=3363976 RepID=UPI003711ACCA
MALAVTAAVALPRLSGAAPVENPDLAGAASQSPAASIAPSPSAQVESCVPRPGIWEESMRRQMQQMDDVLLGAIPSGVRTGQHDCGFGRPYDGAPITSVEDVTEVYVDEHVGTIAMYRIRDTSPRPTGDLCATSPRKRMPPAMGIDALNGVETSCQVLAAKGATVRIGTMRQPAPGTTGQTVVVRHATRYIEGWLILVAELPYAFSSVGPPLLATPIFTTAQLAELAANPGLLP